MRHRRLVMAMTLALGCSLAAWAAARGEEARSSPSVRVRTLGGEIIVGSLARFGREQLAIIPPDGTPEPTSVRVADVLAIEFPGDDHATGAEATARVLLTDGSRLVCQAFTTDGKMARLVLAGAKGEAEGARAADQEPGAAAMELPLDAVAGVSYSREVEEWNRWAREEEKPRASDALRVVKEGKEHDLDGVIGAVTAEGLTFTVDGEEVPVRRERIKALSFRHAKVTADGDAAEVMDRAGNVWIAADVQINDGMLTLKTAGGISRALPVDQLVRVSYSRGRIVHLSDLEPTLVEHTPFFDVAWEYRRDQNFAGTLPRLGGSLFPKGLVVHSRTLLEYDLGGHYRRLAATIGIEDQSGPLGDAGVRILGDGAVLWEERARAGQPGKQIQLPLSGIQKLTLVVDYGGGLDLGDHVLFGDIHVVK